MRKGRTGSCGYQGCQLVFSLLILPYITEGREGTQTHLCHLQPRTGFIAGCNPSKVSRQLWGLPCVFPAVQYSLPVKWSWTVKQLTQLHRFLEMEWYILFLLKTVASCMIWMKAIINSENVFISKNSFSTSFWSLKPSDKRSRKYLHLGFQLFKVLCWNLWKKVLVKIKS